MPKVKPFNDFTWWLNANTTNAVGDKDLIKALNVFYNSAGQLQTRRGYRTFWNQIGSSPITSYFFYQRDDNQNKVAICHSGDKLYSYNWSTRSAISGASNLREFETLPWKTSNRVRRDFVVYKNIAYMCDWVNQYCSFDWTTFNKIGTGSTYSPATVNTTTDEISYGSHWLVVNDEVYFTTSGTIPAWITANQIYYVSSVPTSWTFTISTSPNWSKVDITSSWSGTLSYTKLTEPRPRYLTIASSTCWSSGESKNPSRLYYTNAFSAPVTDLNDLNTNQYELITGQEWDINWIWEYAQGIVIMKDKKTHYWTRATWSLVVNPIDSQTWWYANRAINTVWNSIVYFNERWIDSLAKRAWVDGAWALESQALSTKIRDLINTIRPKSYNSSAWQYIKEVNNYHFVFDSNQDDIPDTMVVYSSLTGGRTQYTFPEIYDFWNYIDADWNRQYLFASANGGQMYEYEYGFDDNWTAIPVDIQTKKFDFGDPSQVKSFHFVDVVWRKQEWGEINLSVYVDEEVVWEWIVSDLQIDTSGISQAIWTRPLWSDILGGEWSELDLYPFTVRIPFFTRWQHISLRIQAEWVQMIFEKMRVGLDAETIETINFNNIL
jgi:hypothetical protein